MKLVTTNTDLTAQLTRLIQTYPNIAFAVAWASANTSVFKMLVKHSARIKKAIIGTHFYQTHPNVLEEFIGSDNVRFILQRKGVFHPKFYLFWDEDKWEALIGSANLTSGAFESNSEIMALVNGLSEDSEKLKSKMLFLIEDYWQEATVADPNMVFAYREVWKRRQPVLRRLVGQYGKSDSKKTPFESSVMSMSWDHFYTAISDDQHHGFHDRCKMLQVVSTAFKKHDNFASMELGLRQFIAGLPTEFDEKWGWFGSMMGAGCFHKAVNNNEGHLSSALDYIPLHGLVFRDQYQNYLSEFIKSFPNGRHGIATASRLLAMKRPDQFVCIDSKNQKGLCRDFGIRKTGMDYERYWDEIIERIMDSSWWNSPRPVNIAQGIAWDGRTAMLDAIFYRE